MKDSIKHLHQTLAELEPIFIDIVETAQEILEDVKMEHNAKFDSCCNSVECKKSFVEVNIIEDIVKQLNNIDRLLGAVNQSFVSNYPEVTK